MHKRFPIDHKNTWFIKWMVFYNEVHYNAHHIQLLECFTDMSGDKATALIQNDAESSSCLYINISNASTLLKTAVCPCSPEGYRIKTHYC